jgi:Tfp pilus assembly protein PilX
MNIGQFRSQHAPAVLSLPGSERGVVLFIALLVMVALSLAGIALIRSADTATIVAGNLAFKQATEYTVDRSIEQAVKALFDPAAVPADSKPVIADKTKDVPEQNYFACVQDAAGGCIKANNPIPEIPTILTTKSKIKAANLKDDLVPDVFDANKKKIDFKSYYVIERMCANAGAAVGTNCNMSAAGLGADAGTQHFEGLTQSGGAFFRVTVRVEGPRNTVAYAQAILQ